MKRGIYASIGIAILLEYCLLYFQTVDRAIGTMCPAVRTTELPEKVISSLLRNKMSGDGRI